MRPLQLATAQYQDVVTSSLTGTLMYEGDCLLFREDGTKAIFLPIWPYGSSFNGTSVIFHNPGKADQRIVLGEEFLMEGMESQWSAVTASAYEPFRQQCGASPFFVRRTKPAN